MKKQYLISLGIVIFAVLLSAGIPWLQKSAPLFQQWQTRLTENCIMPTAMCISAQNSIRQLTSLEFDLQRQQTSKENIPRLHIYLSDGALQKIEDKRNDTLAKTRPILLLEDDDWVKAEVLADNGIEYKKLAIKLRLKGDWGDHLKHPSKLSFRIKPTGSNTIFGMSRFSIQHPTTRNYHFEAMLFEHMRKRGVLTPRYSFVDVWVNDYPVGLMALEEHFTKELLESQDRREGPILAFDEDPIWQQREINNNTIVNHQELQGTRFLNMATHATKDLAVKEYNLADYDPTSTYTSHSIRAQSLLRDYVDGKLRADEVFDLKLVSSWWVNAHMWGACHGTIDHNRRFYFNPITGKLEPIAYDHDAQPNDFLICRKRMGPALDADPLLNSAIFHAHVVEELENWQQWLSDDDFIQEFATQQQNYFSLFDFESFDYKKLSIAQLKSNLSELTNYVSEKKPKNPAARALSRSNIESVKHADYLSRDIDFFMPLRSFVYLEHPETVTANDTESPSRKLKVNLKNLSLDKINIESIYLLDSQTQSETILAQPFELDLIDSENPKSNTHLENLTLDWPENYPNKGEVRVRYQFKGKVYDQIVQPQYQDYDYALKNLIEYSQEISEDIIVNKQTSSISFPTGTYVFNDNYVVPPTWSVTVSPGSEFKLQGKLLRIQGALTMVGTEDMPIKVDISTDTTFKSVGLWGGIQVLQSNKPSRLAYVQLQGHPAVLPNRQDYFGITGCLNFYESDVEIVHSTFQDLQCEDALNIVRSAFELEQIHIDGSAADAFDSDFSKGIVSQSDFTNIGNDGIDISGTDLEINNTSFNAIGDKAISVGEKSILRAANVQIHGAGTGVASKDLSQATLDTIELNNIRGTGLITYIKKGEYGPSSIACQGCSFDNTSTTTTNQYRSQILLDGVDSGVQHFTQKQLVEAGYIEN